MENDSLQSVVDILRRIPLPAIQECLLESPLMSLGKHCKPSPVQWLDLPVSLALQHGLEPMAHAFGADPQELLSYIHPHCPNATACFQRLTLLRPDRVWGGECVYICRTVRPLSMRWNGPDQLELVLVEGSLEIDRSSHHIGNGSPTVSVKPAATFFLAHPSTIVMRRSWITDLVDHAVAAGIPVTIPPVSLPLTTALQEEMDVHARLSRHLLYSDEPLGYPKI